MKIKQSFKFDGGNDDRLSSYSSQDERHEDSTPR